MHESNILMSNISHILVKMDRLEYQNILLHITATGYKKQICHLKMGAFNFQRTQETFLVGIDNARSIFRGKQISVVSQ